MRLTTGNQYLLNMWLEARGDADMPCVNANTYMRDQRVGKNVCLQFMTSEGAVRFAYAGSNVEKMLGMELMGVEVASAFNQSEQTEVRDLQHAKFQDRLIIQAHSNSNTASGDVIQVEILNLPFLNRATGEMIFLIGSFEWTHTTSTPKLVGGLQGRTLLYRKIFDLKTLNPVESEFTFPPIIMPIEEQSSSDRVELA